MYGREYGGKSYTLEPSGGLINASLVMQDRETDSYWYIMSGEVIAGDLKGTKMEELPVGEKMKWKDWVKKHPNTLVLSVKGKEDVPRNAYDNYFASPRGFQGLQAKDERLNTKQPIYAFHIDERSYALPHFRLEGGNSFEVEKGIQVFLYRQGKSDLLRSTVAYLSRDGGFELTEGKWIHSRSGCQFNPATETFDGGGENCPSRLDGFDTFWYNWSLSNPDTKILVN